jgi:SPP1 family predicted phage head-tail adaptor
MQHRLLPRQAQAARGSTQTWLGFTAVKAGDLDQRITLQALSEVNESGELVQSYATKAIVWAKLISWKGTEALEAARVNAREYIRIGIRYRDDVNDTWRVLWGGRTYGIIHLDRTGRRKGELWVTVESVGEV